MKIWFTSDLHFCHNRDFVYAPRGFSNVDEMNEEIIRRWNSVVDPEDTVYILGDLMLMDNEKGLRCIQRLNGKLHIIRGNHDTNSRVLLYMDLPNVVECGAYSDVLKAKGLTFYLSHYPTITSNMEKEAVSLKRRVINLFGHTHQTSNTYEGQKYMYHVGLDSHNCYPVLLDNIIWDLSK